MLINKKIKRYKYTLKVLSPIHIGTNEDFIPTNYVISQEGCSFVQKCECGGPIENGECQWCGDFVEIKSHSNTNDAYLYTFSPKELMSALNRNQQMELLTLSKQTDWSKIRDFFIKNATQIAQKGYKKALVSDKVFYEYTKLTGQSKFYIEKQYADTLTQNPVILGSSIKGSLRTALINFLIQGKSVFDTNNIEKNALNYKDASDDPFKNIKISDAIATKPIVTHIVHQINKRRSTGSELPTKGNMIEVIPVGSVFEGTMTYIQDLDDAKTSKVAPFNLIQACQYFYQNELKNESEYGTRCITTTFYNTMQSNVNPKNISPIRIGKHSGAECVTVAGNRQISVKNCSQKQKNATTMWVCRDKNMDLPFGWADLEINEVE